MEPYQIEHIVDVVGDGDAYDMVYNYLIYRFEGYGSYVWARTYLDDIGTVSIYGPFKSADDLTTVESPKLFDSVVDFLGMRFARIEILGPDGYVPLPGKR